MSSYYNFQITVDASKVKTWKLAETLLDCLIKLNELFFGKGYVVGSLELESEK